MPARTVFFTGAGGFIGKYILRHYLDEPETVLYLLEHGPFCTKLEQFLLETIPDGPTRARAHIIEGDITQAGLGLPDAVSNTLQDTMTHAIHLAAAYDLMVPRDLARRVNVEGTRHVLDFLEGCARLERFGYTSTIAVSGSFSGVYTEEDFDVGQNFTNHYAATKFEAEKLVRERRDNFPTVILRPTVVVGDSKTGVMEKIDGPYQALVMIARNMHLLTPNSGDIKCHIAPVDFIADAFYALFEDPSSVGRVFHVGDPRPMTYDQFIGEVCKRWGKPKPLLKLPPRFIGLLFRLPGFSKILGVSYEAFQYSILPVEYDMRQATRFLEARNLACPPVTAYLDAMLQYFTDHHRDPRIRRAIWREST